MSRSREGEKQRRRARKPNESDERQREKVDRKNRRQIDVDCGLNQGVCKEKARSENANGLKKNKGVIRVSSNLIPLGLEVSATVDQRRKESIFLPYP